MSAAPGGEVIVYEAPDGEVRVDVRLDRETVWLTQAQMAELFGRERSVVTKHVGNAFREGELDPAAVCAKFAHTAADGKTYQVDHYNLDVVISVGYRVKSLRGTQFRIWATRTLREHLVRGYTLDRQRFARNAAELEAALSLVRKAAAGEALTSDQGRGLVDVIARYTQTFLLLQRYDEGLLEEPKGNRGGVLPAVAEARVAIGRLKADLVGRGKATDLFRSRARRRARRPARQPRPERVRGAGVSDGRIEGRALLYFTIKNHPFSDGNKRIGLPSRGLPEPQRPIVPGRRGRDQRCGGSRRSRCWWPRRRQRTRM